MTLINEQPRRRTGISRISQASDVYLPHEIERFKRNGWWRDRLLQDELERHLAERPGEVAVIDEDGTSISWGELAAAVDAVATGLVTMGGARGSFVGIQLPNSIEFVISFLAVQRAGMRPLTMLPIYGPRDVAFMLAKCQATAFIVSGTYREGEHVQVAVNARRMISSLEWVVVVGGRVDDCVSFHDLLRSRRDVRVIASRRPDPDSVSRVSFTSGTTSQPKGVLLTHNIDYVCPSLVTDALGLNQTTSVWMPSPLGHVTGLLFGLYTSLITGAKLVVQDKWDPALGLSLISRESAVFTVSATPFIAAMLECPQLEEHDLSSFRYFVSGGARIPPSTVAAAKERMGCQLLRVFGMSEAPLHTLVFPDDSWSKHVGTDGRPLEGCEVRVVDPVSREPLQPGETGEYATRGPHVFLGYLDEPGLSDEAVDERGWYYSGDMCSLDEDGYVLYVDRIKDIINRGGIKISALEVENLLAAHPAVQTVAVVAVPDERLGEKACAFVVSRKGYSLDLHDVRSFLAERGVTKQKWPERLELLSELPSTPTGKIQKALLREQATRT